jgi:hypothetical protein
MSGNYLIELKDSVFRETPLTEEEFDDDLRIGFASEDHAEAWVAKQNHSHSEMGDLTLHTAHPNDKSNVDAYVVFQPIHKVWMPDPDA